MDLRRGELIVRLYLITILGFYEFLRDRADNLKHFKVIAFYKLESKYIVSILSLQYRRLEVDAVSLSHHADGRVVRA